MNCSLIAQEGTNKGIKPIYLNRMKNTVFFFVTAVFDLTQDQSVEHGVGAFSLFVGLKGTTEELGLKANNLWAFTE